MPFRKKKKKSSDRVLKLYDSFLWLEENQRDIETQGLKQELEYCHRCEEIIHRQLVSTFSNVHWVWNYTLILISPRESNSSNFFSTKINKKVICIFDKYGLFCFPWNMYDTILLYTPIENETRLRGNMTIQKPSRHFFSSLRKRYLFKKKCWIPIVSSALRRYWKGRSVVINRIGRIQFKLV